MDHIKDLNAYAAEVHAMNKPRWWTDLHTNEPLQRNTGELLMLVVTELAEALEGHRKDLPDDKLPHRKMFDVEIVDAIIRLLDIGAGRGIDLETIYQEKLAYNQVREDHQTAHRLTAGGKKY